jgi:hypothetical protein
MQAQKQRQTKLTNDDFRALSLRGDAKELFERQKGKRLQTFMNGREPIDYSYQTCVDTIRGSRFIDGEMRNYHNEDLFAIYRQIVNERLKYS